MSLDQSAMLNSQREIFGRISRAVDNLKKMGQANITLSAIETRIRLLDDVIQRSVLSEQANRFTSASASTSFTPQFLGTYEDCPSFRDLFWSVIGDNTSISQVERLHYLRSCLQGSAPKLSRVHNAQESIGRPIDSHGMDLFNHLVVELFNSRTRLEWESSSGDSFEPPSHDTLMNFITKRILTLNAANPKNTVEIDFVGQVSLVVVVVVVVVVASTTAAAAAMATG